MTKQKYELGFNWPRDRDDLFVSEACRYARLRGIRAVCIPKDKAEDARRRVDRRTLVVGLFLNTQADGRNMESPHMLLCRSLKAAGTLVVEDPDDAKNYADRTRLMDYLRRAGIAVPRFLLIGTEQPDRLALTKAQRGRLGETWVAQPAIGMSRNRLLVSKAKSVRTALAKAGFRAREKVLLWRRQEPAISGGRELRFLVWHLFGHIAICWPREGAGPPELMQAQDLISGRYAFLADLAVRIAGITGLDWFVTEVLGTRSATRPRFVVIEPANALAGLGPGIKAANRIPPEVTRLAAGRIVEVAWRRSRDLALTQGTTIHVTE